MRFQQRVPRTGKTKTDAMLEAFNLFDRANYGDYVTDEASPLYGKPIYVNNLAYAPRTVQLGPPSDVLISACSHVCQGQPLGGWPRFRVLRTHCHLVPEEGVEPFRLICS